MSAIRLLVLDHIHYLYEKSTRSVHLWNQIADWQQDCDLHVLVTWCLGSSEKDDFNCKLPPFCDFLEMQTFHLHKNNGRNASYSPKIPPFPCIMMIVLVSLQYDLMLVLCTNVSSFAMYWCHIQNKFGGLWKCNIAVWSNTLSEAGDVCPKTIKLKDWRGRIDTWYFVSTKN